MGAAGFAIAAGGLLSASAQISSANAEARSLRSQARLNDLQAKEVERQTRREVDIFKKESEVAFGNQVSSFAKSGVDISGSPLLVLANTKQDLLNEQEEIKRRGEIEARLLRAGSSNLRSQAFQTRQAGRTSVFGTLLTTGANIAGSID